MLAAPEAPNTFRCGHITELFHRFPEINHKVVGTGKRQV
jgi:hypothetical protein